MDNGKLYKHFPALKEGDYWSETEDGQAVFYGRYLGYEFSLTYSFKQHKWINHNNNIPHDILGLLEWELYLHERWLTHREKPEI